MFCGRKLIVYVNMSTYASVCANASTPEHMSVYKYVILQDLLSLFNDISTFVGDVMPQLALAQSAGAVEYTSCFFAEG